MDVESRIEAVTLYARGARVRRVAAISLAPGTPRVRIIGLPAALIDDTVRIEAGGGAIVTALHVGLDAPAPAVAADEVTPELRAARRRVALAAAEVERLEAGLAILAAAPVAVTAVTTGAAGTDPPPPAWGALVDARRALVTLRGERELALRDQLAAARRELELARRTLAAATDRDHRAGSARTARLHELRKHVELELEAHGATSARLHLEYQVAAARWAPSYVARIDGEAVVFELRASIAQDTGEDWTGVAVRLSTAEPERFGALPELASQRIGRRQLDPARAGFRAPPVGAAALYADYVRAFPQSTQAALDLVAREEESPRSGAAGALKEEVWDEETSRAKYMFAMQAPANAPRGGAPPPPMAQAVATLSAAPQPVQPMMKTMMAAPSYGVARQRATLLGGGGDGGGLARPEGAPSAPAAAAASPGPPPARLDYTNLRMALPGSPRRGTLIGALRDSRIASLDGEVGLRVTRVQALALPGGCAADWPHTYDYAFDTDGAVDVTADGAWHSIAVATRPSTAKLRHVAVPRQQADVFRLAAVTNPLAGPLLPGPIDVYDRGSFLVTSAVEHTPPGATVEIGLGVDAQVKLSRNTEFREETTGMLRGGLRLHHAIRIDIDNLSERAIDLEVRERLPVAREGDDDVEVITGKIEPAWERWTPDPDAPRERRLRGGYRWRLAVPARQKRALRAAYEVKIAGKLELVGGNRRES